MLYSYSFVELIMRFFFPRTHILIDICGPDIYTEFIFKRYMEELRQKDAACYDWYKDCIYSSLIAAIKKTGEDGFIKL